ncbi:MAG TPA: O-antigen ligase family protein, partial [Dehalococcoidia bacterium]|nr:O-antigen ligase family protein [Dehalococcoidia bacterium]
MSNRLSPALRKTLDILLLSSPLWAFCAIAYVYTCLALGIQAYIWPALILACAPLVLNYLRTGSLSNRTIFDLPILIYLVTVINGLIISAAPQISLMGFVSVFLMLLLYYFIANYPFSRAAMYWSIAGLIILPAATIVIGYSIWPQFVEWSTVLGGIDLPAGVVPHHNGISSALFFCGLVLLGMLIMWQNRRLQIVFAVVFAVFTALVVWLDIESLSRLILGISFDGRIETLWLPTIEMIKANPVSGIGFGCWAYVFHRGKLAALAAHPHNAYLEYYVHTGILGAIAALLAFILGIRAVIQIFRSGYMPFWSGLTLGLVLAMAGMLLLGIIEDTPSAYAIAGSTSYHYLVSPFPWLIGAGLAAAH